jgi:hypothetical protein
MREADRKQIEHALTGTDAHEQKSSLRAPRKCVDAPFESWDGTGLWLASRWRAPAPIARLNSRAAKARASSDLAAGAMSRLRRMLAAGIRRRPGFD